MGGYKIQLKDKNGNRQYPVSTTDVVVSADGVSVADLLDRKQPTLVSGVNIKTINGKTLLGEGDLVIEGGNGDSSASVETRVLYVYLEGAELTEEEKAYNKETYDKIANGENVQLVFDVLGVPITHAFYAGDLLFTCSVVVIEGSALYGQGRLFSDGNYEFEEGVIGGSSGETAESDVICVVWDDDTSDIPSNKEAYQKLAESINTVGKPAAVMVCVETGYRWGIAKYYWKSNVGGDIELTTPVTESGLYCVFTLTSEGVCTASYKQVDLGGSSDESYPIYTPLNGEELTEEQKAANKKAYDGIAAAWDADAPQMPYVYLYELGKGFPLLVVDFNAEEGFAGLILSADIMPVLLSDYSLPISGTGLVSASEGFTLYSDGSVVTEYAGNFISPDILAMRALIEAKNVKTRWLYASNAGSISDSMKEYNKETVEKIANGENIKLMMWPLYVPVEYIFADGGIVFTVSCVIDDSLVFGQGSVGPDGVHEYEEYTFAQGGGSSLKEVLFYIGTSLTAVQKATNVASYNAWMQAGGGYIKSDFVLVDVGGLVMRPSVVLGKNGNLLASLVITEMPSSINSSGDYPLKTIWYTIHSDGTTNETTNSEL